MGMKGIYYNTIGKEFLRIKVYAQNTLVKTIEVKDNGQNYISYGKKKFIITNEIQDFKKEKRAKVFCYDVSSCMPFSNGKDKKETLEPIKMRLETISPEELQAAMEKQTVIDLMSIGITDMEWVKYVVYGVIVIALGYFIYNMM